MKKVFLCLMALAILSCSSDDENASIIAIDAISFNFNGVDYFLTDYSVMLNTTNTVDRVVEVSFDNHTKTLLFSVLEEETNQIDDFILIENGIYYSSDPIYGDRETSIITHTDSKMEGTFRATLKDTHGRPVFIFTNGIINIEY
jgi:hypothetical protein